MWPCRAFHLALPVFHRQEPEKKRNNPKTKGPTCAYHVHVLDSKLLSLDMKKVGKKNKESIKEVDVNKSQEHDNRALSI